MICVNIGLSEIRLRKGVLIEIHLLNCNVKLLGSIMIFWYWNTVKFGFYLRVSKIHGKIKFQGNG